MAPASWYLLLCVISFPWVKTGPNDSLLFWRKQQPWWDVTSKTGLQKDYSSHLADFFFHAFSLAWPIESQVSRFELPCGKVHKTGQKRSKKKTERPSIQLAQGPVWKWVPFQLRLEMTWSLSNTLIEILGETLSQREDPAKPHLDFWPTKFMRWILF